MIFALAGFVEAEAGRNEPLAEQQPLEAGIIKAGLAASSAQAHQT